MTPRQHVDRILTEITEVLNHLDENQFNGLCQAIRAANRVFVTGQGRSGFVARAFAQRLMHLGLDARFTGETTTPPIGIDDLLVAVSRSGERPVTISYLRTAKQAGAGAVVLTGNREATSPHLGSFTVVLAPKEIETQQVGGSLFEQSALLYLEAVVAALARLLGETNESMLKRHANLE